MKKILLIIFLCLFSISLNAKTIKYKGDNLLKEYKVKTTRAGYSNGNKIWNHNIYLKIEGKIVGIDNLPITNKEIYIKNNKTGADTIYSDNNGIFKFEINDSCKTYEDNYFIDISLEFNNKNQYELNNSLKQGYDISIINPYKIYIQANSEQECYLYLSNNDIRENLIFRNNNNDVIILSSQTFSAQYYRDKISIIDQANEMFKKENLNYNRTAIETLILDEDKNIKGNWKDIVKKEIVRQQKFAKEESIRQQEIAKKESIIQQANEMLKKADLKIAVETIILDENKNIQPNWKELVKKEIKKFKNIEERADERQEAFYAIQEAEISGVLVNYGTKKCSKCKNFTLEYKDYYVGQYPELSSYNTYLGKWFLSIFSCKFCNYLLVRETIQPNSYGLKHKPKNFNIKNNQNGTKFYRRVIFDGKY